MTKFKSQALHIIKIKYWKASGSGNPPCLIPALRKIDILGLNNEILYTFLHTTVLRYVSTTFSSSVPCYASKYLDCMTVEGYWDFFLSQSVSYAATVQYYSSTSHTSSKLLKPTENKVT